MQTFFCLFFEKQNNKQDELKYYLELPRLPKTEKNDPL